MKIDNHGDIQRNFQAKANIREYHKYKQTIENLGSNDRMVTNIYDMEDKLNNLVEKGKISDEDRKYIHMKSILDEAMEIHIKPVKSLEDITGFYESCINFDDLYKSHKGDLNE